MFLNLFNFGVVFCSQLLIKQHHSICLQGFKDLFIRFQCDEPKYGSCSHGAVTSNHNYITVANGYRVVCFMAAILNVDSWEFWN